MKTIIACNLKFDLPECVQPKEFHMPYGLAIIMEILNEYGIKCDCFDTYVNGDTKTFLEYYAKHKHDVLLFSGIIGNYAYQYYGHVFSHVKAINPASTIILGGPITSVYPDLLLKTLPVDIVVIGEGEETFRELIEHGFACDENLLSIDGLGFTYKGETFVTPERKALRTPLEASSYSPLFSHPGFDKLLHNYITTQKGKRRGWDITATRGCIGNCTFCKRIFDKPIRSFSVDYIVKVMEFVNKEYGIDRFNFLDENFVTNKRNIRAFLDILEEKNLNLKWRIRSRMDNIPVGELDRMVKQGLYGIMLGLESGSQKVLDHFNKHVVLDKHKDEIREIADRGLLYSSFVIGSQVESQETIRENIDLIEYLKLKRHEIVICFLSVIPATPIFEDLYDRGIIKDRLSYIRNYVGDFEELEFNISPMSDEELLMARENMIMAGAQ